MTTSATPTAPSFSARQQSIEAQPGYQRPAAWAVGLAAFGSSGAPLDTYFPLVNLQENFGSAAVIADAVGHRAGNATYALERQHLDQVLADFASLRGDGQVHQNLRVLDGLAQAFASGESAPVRRPVVTFLADLASRPSDVHDAYLRLHLLSYRKIQPHGVNLDGIFAVLPNVVWTSLGPFEPATFEMTRLEMRARGVEIQVHGLDKFPRLTDYVIPSGVRIADANRVRLGAHLAEGTTVMHEGFVNYNSGTLGASMVEGRISAGVVVGNGSDVGGGASIMGTLSGGGKEIIRVGEGCLIGANAGIGISLGNGCTVEAGLYVTAGSRVSLPDGRVVKAAELTSQDDLLFRRNSQTGAIEVIGRKNQVVLNEALHGHN